MKLLELLVKERIEWHPEALCYTQDSDDMRVYPYTTNKPDLQGVYWGSADVISGRSVEMPELADDWQTAIVTKEQYDNACKLVDDGYTLWFGGECPVNSREKVRVVLDDDSQDGHDDFNRASDWRWEWVDGLTNIIAYKVVKPVLISTHKHDAPLEAFRAAGWTDDLLIEHGFAKIAEPFRPGVSCSEIPSAALTHKYQQACDSTDVVNHPSHYTNGKVECIDAIESATVGKTGIEAVCVANVIKYLWRYEDKNGLEDIKKAQWYLNKLIEVKK